MRLFQYPARHAFQPQCNTTVLLIHIRISSPNRNHYPINIKLQGTRDCANTCMHETRIFGGIRIQIISDVSANELQQSTTVQGTWPVIR